ncbi:MAG: hypothetical protein NTW16_15015 [Bacteroidetes bacterium]|nr:hypothetical protein [Bacteroidota bacterium]
MCKQRNKQHAHIYYYPINPNIQCPVIFSFGFYHRNNFGGLNPYGLFPIPSQNLYTGPFIPNWAFGVNLRVRCQGFRRLCNQNIQLARNIHTIWHNSAIWQTHPHYVNGPNDQGVDFIASLKTKKVYIYKGAIVDQTYKDIADWFEDGIARYGIGIEVEKVDVLPADGIDIVKWILDRINDINDLDPFQGYLALNGQSPIPTTIF